MNVTTNIAIAVVAANVRELDGKAVTRPTLAVSGSAPGSTYVIDVDIGQTRVDPNTAEVVPAILVNVPVANGDQSVLYVEIGAPVRLRRSTSGDFEVVGFSKRAPGRYTRLPVLIGEPGEHPISVQEYAPTDITISTRRLAYEELTTYGGYGKVPYGAIGKFQAGNLVEVI